MGNLLWDGPEDSDEEIEELAIFKNEFEKEQGIVFSKNGIKKYIHTLLENESDQCAVPFNSKKWLKRLDTKDL
jgi:hypothetical protein